MTEAVNAKVYSTLSQHYLQLPHCQAIGLRFEHADNRSQTLSVDWRGDLLGNEDTQVLHGGSWTATSYSSLPTRHRQRHALPRPRSS